MTLKKHFDMDELLQHLIYKDGNNGMTKVGNIIIQSPHGC